MRREKTEDMLLNESVLSIIIIKFGYNARSHWLKERAL